MTAPELRAAIRAVEAATAGEWEQGLVRQEIRCGKVSIGEIIGEGVSGWQDEQNSRAIVTAVNFLRTHKDALLAMVSVAEAARNANGWVIDYDAAQALRDALAELNAARAHPQESE